MARGRARSLHRGREAQGREERGERGQEPGALHADGAGIDALDPRAERGRVAVVGAREHDAQGAFVPGERRGPLRGPRRSPRALSQQGPRDLGSEQAGALPGAARLDGDARDTGQQLAGLGDGGLVTRDEHHRHAETAGHGGVQGELAGFDHVVDPHTEDLVGVGVVEHGGGRAGAGVIADEQGCVEALVDARHHAQGGRRAAHQTHGRRQPVGREVGAAIVGVADDDLVGAAGETALDDGVEVTPHEPPGPLVGRACRARSAPR